MDKRQIATNVPRKAQYKSRYLGKLTVLKGKLKFYELTENGNVISEHIFTPESDIPFVEPQAWHRVEALSDDLECTLGFYCKKKITSVKIQYDCHSRRCGGCCKIISPCKVLDLGCGQGRNSLYLSLLGYDVTSWDHNENSIAF